MMIKYRVHEVAKDFNLASKDITEILTEYATTPKNHMQVLEIPELDLIFEYLTQHHEIESLEEVFRDDKPAQKPTAEPEKSAAVQSAQTPAAATQPTQTSAAAQPAQTPAAPRAEKPHMPRKQAEKRVVDTRGSTAVNIDKYNEKFDELAGSRGREGDLRRGGKERSSTSRSSVSNRPWRPPNTVRRSARSSKSCSLRSQKAAAQGLYPG